MIDAWIWVSFIVGLLSLLALDLGVFHRKPGAMPTSVALVWTAGWVVMALAFNVVIFFLFDRNYAEYLALHPELASQAAELSKAGTFPILTGNQAAMEFLTGYLVEQSLSLDNVFVIALIFAYFHIPSSYQHRVLFWGIIGAVFLRGIMIGLGAELVKQFVWLNYVFGLFLIFTAVKMLLAGDHKIEPEQNPIVKLARKFYPVSTRMDGQKFFTRLDDGRKAFTPLAIVLIIVESTDLLFAVDSIPAILAITHDSFVAFTSNVFAVMGLRSLYFALAGMMDQFRYLKISLVFILAFVGVKMMLGHHFKIATEVSLGVIVAALAIGVMASILANRRDLRKGVAHHSMSTSGQKFHLESGEVYMAFGFLLVSTLICCGLAFWVLDWPKSILIGGSAGMLITQLIWLGTFKRKIRRHTLVE